MFELSTLLSFVSASILLCLAPGPDNIFVLTISAAQGRRAGLLVTLGICSGLIVHSAAVALGLAVIFQASDLAFDALKVAGALYLLYLAWEAFTAQDSSLENQKETKTTTKDLFKKGAIMNLSNPKVAIFFLAFLPQFVPTDTTHVSFSLLALGGTFILVAGTVFGTIAVLSSVIGQALRQHPNTQALLNKASALIFVGLALRLLFTEK